MTQNVVVLPGNYYVFEFGILGTGRLSGNLSELQGRSFDLFVFDDAGYASFRDGSNSVAPLFEQSGTRVLFALNLTGSGQYHVVAVDDPPWFSSDHAASISASLSRDSFQPWFAPSRSGPAGMPTWCKVSFVLPS